MPTSNSDARKRMEAAKEAETAIIGLSGWAQSGKDSTANVLEGSFGFQKLAFAEKLRSVARAANPLVAVVTGAPRLPGEYEWSLGSERIHAEWVYRNATSPEVAYEWLKANSTYRTFLQDLGTAVRNHLGEMTWVDAALADVRVGGKYVVTDVRFQNEARAIQARGGVIWRIQRAGHKPANDHISERDLDDWSFDRVLSMPDYADDLAALYQATYAQLGDLLSAVPR